MSEYSSPDPNQQAIADVVLQPHRPAVERIMFEIAAEALRAGRPRLARALARWADRARRATR